MENKQDDSADSVESTVEETPPVGYNELALLLPFEVKVVVSYITWMEELANHVEKSAIYKSSSLDNYIKLILEDEKSQQNEYGTAAGDGEDDDSDWSDNIGHVATKMNVAAMFTYLGNFESAETHLNLLKPEYLEKLNLTEKQRQVIEYFWDSLAWSIGVLKTIEEIKRGINHCFLIKGSSKLQCRYEKLSEGDDTKIKATLAFLKACLSAAMKVPEIVTLRLLLEATKLDPECHIWFHYAYRLMRRLRRNIKRSGGRRLPSPSPQEQRLAKTAYDLQPDDVVVIADYGLVLKETLWMEHQGVWKEQEEDYLKCVELFEKALSIANETGNTKWSRKVKIYLAEFLCFGKGEKLDQDAGKVMFDECALEYPRSTFVLHKVGKLYHHGLARFSGHDGKCIDLERAKDCYKRAIDSNPCNYACLMDYLKLLQRLHEYPEMIKAVDKALENSKRDYQVAKLHIAKAYITWIWNPMDLIDHRAQATKWLMFVLKNLPEFEKDVYFTNDPIFFDYEHPASKIKTEILQYIQHVKQHCPEEIEFSLYDNLIEGLSKAVDPNRFREKKKNWNNDCKPREIGDELTSKMKGLSVSTNGNFQRPREQGEWKSSKREHNIGNGSGDENFKESADQG